MKIKRKFGKKWIVLGLSLAFMYPIPLVTGKFYSGHNLATTLLANDMLYTGLVFLVCFIILQTDRQPRLEPLKTVSGMYFFAGCLAIFYNWPVFIVSAIAAMVYLKNLDKTNGKRKAVIFFLVMSILGIVFILQMFVRYPYMWDEYWKEW